MLGGGRVELRLVLEFEQKMERARQAQLLLKPAVNGRLHAFGTPGVAAAAVGPIQRPESFRGRALLEQQLTVPVEDQQ
jgi:hypothetical protein